MTQIPNPANLPTPEPTPAPTPEPTPTPTPEPTPTPAPAPVTPPVDTKLFGALIPEEFKDRPYLKDISGMEVNDKSYEELFKKLDGAQKLIGRKAMPDATSTPEEWQEYYTKVRPETADLYELNVPEGETANEEVVKGVKDIFHKAGLTKEQASTVHDEFNTLMKKQAEVFNAKGVEQDKAFEELTKNTFGEEAEAKMATAKTMLTELAPENVKPFIAKLDNSSLVVLAGILNSVHDKYGVEGKKLGGDGTPTGGSTVPELISKGQELMLTKEYTDGFHPQHDARVAEVNALYKRIGALQTAAKKA